MLNLLTAYNLKNLLAKLKKNLAASDSNPFRAKEIIIENSAQADWLTFEIAKHFGVAFNLKFTFINDFFKTILETFEKNIDLNYYSKHNLQWRIIKILQNNPNINEILSLYLEDNNPAKLFQISKLIAQLFYQYQIFRPDLIIDWNKNIFKLDTKNDHWQFKIWQEIKKDINFTDYSEIILQFLRYENNFEKINLPKTLNIFGIFYLPPIFLKLLEKLSSNSSINLYIFNPCPQEYWFDLKTEKEKLKKQNYFDLSTAEINYEETKNSLLTYLGKTGREFLDSLFNLSNLSEEDLTQDYTEINNNTLLKLLQKDILTLEDANFIDRIKIPIKTQDYSLEIHSCHNILRELEVLKDYLFKLFSQDQSLTPQDIFVLTPNITEYAPYIEAIFTKIAPKTPYFEFSICDLKLLNENKFINLFLKILQFKNENFKITKILELLDNTIIQHAFGFNLNSLQIIKNWLKETDIKYGLNKNKNPATENTWENGLQRLLLSFALTQEKNEFYLEHGYFSNLLPTKTIEGDNSILLGNFIYFLDQLNNLYLSIKNQENISNWQEILFYIIDEFIKPSDDFLNEVVILKNLILGLTNKETNLIKYANFTSKISLDLLLFYLQDQLTEMGYNKPFFRRGITFGNINSLAGIPNKIICVLGLNQNIFPQKPLKTSFDLLTKYPLKGDLNYHDLDKYHFLLTLLSAETNLYLSYIGQNQTDLSLIPSSPIITELKKYLQANFIDENNQDIVEKVCFSEKLFGFNPAYFQKNTKSASFSLENYQIAQNLQNNDVKIKKNNLSKPDSKFQFLNLSDFLNFFQNPIKFFFEKRLNIYLTNYNDELTDTPYFEIPYFKKKIMFQESIPLLFQNFSPEKIYQVYFLKNFLPPKDLGKHSFTVFYEEILEYFQEIKNITPNLSFSNIEGVISINSFSINCYFENFTNNKLINYTYSKNKAKNFTSAWLKHLLINYLLKDSISSYIIISEYNKIKTYQFSPIEPDTAKKYLENLLSFYWQGLQNPLPFFPRLSLLYTENQLKYKNEEENINEIKDKWQEKFYGEAQNIYHQQIYQKYLIMISKILPKKFICRYWKI